jgi:hypothetical protein
MLKYAIPVTNRDSALSVFMGTGTIYSIHGMNDDGTLKRDSIIFMLKYAIPVHYRHSTLYGDRQGFGSVSGSGSSWLCNNLSCWIWIQICIQIADPDPGGQKYDPQK